MGTLVMEMGNLLDELSLCNFGSSHQRNAVLSVLNEIGVEMGSLLADKIWTVRDKVYSSVRDKFVMFCQSHDVTGDVAGYCHGIDFTQNVRFGEVAAGRTLYQWCSWKADGKLEVGQWFTTRKIRPERLGLSPFIDMVGPRGGFHGTGTRVLCTFEMPFDKECVISRAATTYDTWSVKRYFDGEYIDWNGLLSKGGAEQYFVPLTTKEKNQLREIANVVEPWAG